MVKRRKKISGSPRLKLRISLTRRRLAAVALLTLIAITTLLTYSNFFSSVDSRAGGTVAVDSKNASANNIAYFKASPTSSRTVLLEWSSFSEIGKDYYSLDRSADSVNFSAIGIVQIQSNSSSQITYSYVDTQPLEGSNYYRLRQTDYRGWCKHFETIPVAVITENQMMALSGNSEKIMLQ